MTPQDAARILHPLLGTDEDLRDALALLCERTGCKGLGDLGLKHPDLLVGLAEGWTSAMDFQPELTEEEEHGSQAL